MSNYIKITENEVLLLTEDVTDIEVEALKEKVLYQLQQEVSTRGNGAFRKGRAMKNSKILKRVAAAILIFGIATPTAVYAAEKWNLFDGLFRGQDTNPIEQYVEIVDMEQAVSENTENVQQPENSIYQMENDDYSIAVDSFVYSEATDYGIVQFTVTQKNADSSAWYNVAEWNELYRDWKVWDATEIFAGMGNKKLWFEVNGLNLENNRCFMKQIDARTTVCYLCFNDMESSSMADRNLKLSVKESKLVKHGEIDDLIWTQIMKLDVPMGESMPSYTWYDAKGEPALILTSVDFWLLDAPESAVCGNDVILKEVSVQKKDGSQYNIHSEKQKIIDWFYATQKEEGTWRNFAGVIDLEEVISFTADGKVFYVEDAVKSGF